MSRHLRAFLRLEFSPLKVLLIAWVTWWLMQGIAWLVT